MPIAPRFERVCRWPRTLVRSCRQTLFNRDSFIKRRSFRRRRRFRSFAALGNFLSIAIALSFRHISYAAAIHCPRSSVARTFVFSPERSLNPKARGNWEGIGCFRLRKRIDGIAGKTGQAHWLCQSPQGVQPLYGRRCRRQ